MKLARWFVFLLVPGLGECGGDSVQPPTTLSVQGDHFVVVASSDKASQAELDAVLQRAESLFGGISSYVGASRTPLDRIRVVLEGDQAGSGSHLDVDGLHLVRYPIDEGGYLAVLAHELVHAFGAQWFIEHEAWSWPTYRYFDEGFAEYLAQETDPDKTGFPFFGFPEDAVVGNWLRAGTAIPHEVLRTRHAEINDRCDLQAYTLRASWMRHLEEVAGRDAVLAVVYPHEEPTNSVVQSMTGFDLPALDSAWEAWLETRYVARTDTATVREAYGARTPWYRPCVGDVDY